VDVDVPVDDLIVDTVSLLEGEDERCPLGDVLDDEPSVGLELPGFHILQICDRFGLNRY